jgi:hypothetical protein
MTRLLLATSFAILSHVLFLAQPLFATHAEGLGTSWSHVPETERSHPSRVTLAIAVFRDTSVTRCWLQYEHNRRISFDLGSDHSSEYFVLPKRGKIKIDLEIATPGGALDVAKRSMKVKRDENGARWAWMGWIDDSGHASDPDYKPVEAFPLQVEAGDVLIFSVQFTKKPKLLGIERTDEAMRRDALFLSVECSSCGSNDTPCPEIW